MPQTLAGHAFEVDSLKPFYSRRFQGFVLYLAGKDKKSSRKDLAWVGMTEASAWLKALRLKTALGAIKPTDNLEVFLDVIDKNGDLTQDSVKCPTYLWTHETCEKSKCISYENIKQKRQELINKHKDSRLFRM